MMNILFIAPLPPPVGGHSIVSQALLDELVADHNVEIVNFNKKNFQEGLDSFKRIFEVLEILWEIWRKKARSDVIYLTISESFAGNIKDLFIYLICCRRLSKMFIHLHGGSIKKLLWNRYKFLFIINKIFIRKLAGVIISGRSHIDIFNSFIPKIKIHIVPNFAQEYLFLSEKEILSKFCVLQPLRILYISNFIPKKGFNEILYAYFALNNTLKQKVKIEFAGRFDSDFQKKAFLDKIDGVEQITYHGVVDDAKKKMLFTQAHIFCLPTSFLEGQPISILEAYASGCVVLTTGQSGIRDIFTNNLNGLEVRVKSATSIRLAIEHFIKNPEEMIRIALTNRRLAGEKYRMKNYNLSLRNIIEGAKPCAVK